MHGRANADLLGIKHLPPANDLQFLKFMKLLELFRFRTIFIAILTLDALAIPTPAAENEASFHAKLRLEQGHPWRPPFGLDRIGRPLTALVEIKSDRNFLVREYWLSSFLEDKEVERQILTLPKKPALVGRKRLYSSRATLTAHADSLALFAKLRFQGEAEEVARIPIEWPEFEADAVVRPDPVINPVDLGAVLVPADWLLLATGQKAQVEVAAISRTQDRQEASVAAWFEGEPQKKVTAPLDLIKFRRQQTQLELPMPSTTRDLDILHVTISGGEGVELWHKKIQTMLVHELPHWPRFGARETKLRYDAPISLRDPKTGEMSVMNYQGAWNPQRKDVVVFLPNGSRFVLWRGTSYVPFWAGKNNTALSYEWAETSALLAPGFVDSVEPLMDKELRYGRVEIIESTAARVHVRWGYESTDFNYKVWGDYAVEDFYFYPDGFGTRVLTLQSSHGNYEVSEFIILTPQAAYPLEWLPRHLVDVIFLDGEKRQVLFPAAGATSQNRGESGLGKPRDIPAVFRVRLHKDEAANAIYFHTSDTNLPPVTFAPFFDRGYMVTPAYWGSHWPLARGKTTGRTIDDRIYASPAHNSLMTWARQRPDPISQSSLTTLDTLGQAKQMTLQRWVWFIGMTAASDAHLLARARSFSRPPSLEIKGARLDLESYVPERRAVRLIVENNAVQITFKPIVPCFNPVFELRKAPKTLARVALAQRSLKPNEYAWDGQTLWLDAEIGQETTLELDFTP